MNGDQIEGICIWLTFPSKLGMIGPEPLATIFASGRKIDSRRYASSAVTVLPSSRCALSS